MWFFISKLYHRCCPGESVRSKIRTLFFSSRVCGVIIIIYYSALCVCANALKKNCIFVQYNTYIRECIQTYIKGRLCFLLGSYRKNRKWMIHSITRHRGSALCDGLGNFCFSSIFFRKQTKSIDLSRRTMTIPHSLPFQRYSEVRKITATSIGRKPGMHSGGLCRTQQLCWKFSP